MFSKKCAAKQNFEQSFLCFLSEILEVQGKENQPILETSFINK